MSARYKSGTNWFLFSGMEQHSFPPSDDVALHFSLVGNKYIFIDGGEKKKLVLEAVYQFLLEHHLV